MLISHQAKFIFIHVQKTGGTSIDHMLRQHFPDAVRWHGKHGRARDGIAEMGMERWRDYYSFAFVRNPWDRLVSWYAMIDDRRRARPFYKRWQREPFKIRIWNQVVTKGRTFEEFLDNCTEIIFDRGCYKSFAFNQIDYLTDANGHMAVDQVCRFENLAEEVSGIFARLGIKDELPRRNKSEHGHYSSWYDARTRDLVAERFARDIEAFGYAFEAVGQPVAGDEETSGRPVSAAARSTY
jgi:hypothetical protein